jgi:aspartyl-tRNA synthetase
MDDSFSLITDSLQQMQSFHYNASQQIPTTYFTVHCGEIRSKDDGTRVKISGKVVKRPRSVRFLEVKDLKGCTQLVATDDKPEILLKFQSIPNDAYITVIGTVQIRPNNFANHSIATGSVEIAVEEFEKVIMPITMDSMSNPMQQNQGSRAFSTSASLASSSSIAASAAASTSQSKSKGITSIEYKKSASENIIKYFTNRKLTCGDLRRDNVGQNVNLVGWLDSKKHGKFLQLKDGYGITQIIIDPEDLNMKQLVANAQEDSIVLVKGRVISRPPNMVRNNSDTGEIEVIVVDFKILDPNEDYVSPDGIESEPEAMIDLNSKDEDANSTTTNQQVSSKIVEKPKVNLFTYRTHTCGELNESNIGQQVTLAGWLEFSRMRKFFTLRDGYGCTQVIIPDELLSTYDIEAIPYESILKVTGLVCGRPFGMRNESMSTGHIEIVMKSLVVLNEAKKNLPIEVRSHNKAKESLRMEYRYMDLRFSDMQRNLRTRSKVIMKMREYLINHCGFIEVETPTLFRRTPGGKLIQSFR